jgi:hypothetical protein
MAESQTPALYSPAETAVSTKSDAEILFPSSAVDAKPADDRATISAQVPERYNLKLPAGVIVMAELAG